jgi:hypothetical protein
MNLNQKFFWTILTTFFSQDMVKWIQLDL